jgi:hypothetical protein
MRLKWCFLHSGGQSAGVLQKREQTLNFLLAPVWLNGEQSAPDGRTVRWLILRQGREGLAGIIYVFNWIFHVNGGQFVLLMVDNPPTNWASEQSCCELF